jgi:hypothetical protein
MQHWSGAAKIKFYSITSVASRCKPINRVPVKALIIKRAGHRRDFFAKSAGVRHCGVGIQRFPVRPDQCPLCADFVAEVCDDGSYRAEPIFF